MVLVVKAEQEGLSDAVRRVAARHAPIDKPSADFDSIAAPELPGRWEKFTAHGFRAVHLPESAGGQGGTLGDLACVIETAAAALLPGPVLSTAAANAVAAPAEVSRASLLAGLTAGATAVVVLPEDSDVRAIRQTDGWRL